MKKTRLLISGLTLAAIGAGISACTPSNAAQAGGGTGPAASSVAPAGAVPAAGMDVATGQGGADTSTGPGAYILQSMPTGTVSLTRGAQGQLLAHVVMFGLTPGSAHDALITTPGASAFAHVVRFSVLTADATGQVSTTLTSVGSVGRLSPLSRFVIRLGSSSVSGSSALAAEPVAESGLLPVHPGSPAVFAFHAVSPGTDGGDQPAGRTTITFDAAAQTLTVSVTASGLNPGPHAAHIHVGSCQSQGGVKYMLPDFIADGHGDIVNQTRVITGVTSVPGPGSWYLNLHQGGMNQILANGAPTLYFRPLLCTNITSFATTSTAPSTATPSPTMTAMPTSTPIVTPTATASANPTVSPTVTVSPSPTTPSPTPTGQPTHW